MKRITTSRKDDIVTVDFAAPREMIDDPRLALFFSPGYFGSGIDADGGYFQFYVPLAPFRSTEPSPGAKD